MQALVQYGRLLARALVTGVHSELHLQPIAGSAAACAQKNRPDTLHLVTASSGISKTNPAAQMLKKWSFGDDACFIRGHSKGDVLGKELGNLEERWMCLSLVRPCCATLTLPVPYSYEFIGRFFSGLSAHQYEYFICVYSDYQIILQLKCLTVINIQ